MAEASRILITGGGIGDGDGPGADRGGDTSELTM